MTRPRTAAIVSATVASTSAFLVVNRWSLFGTVAGVVLFATVNTLVAHWSAEGLDRFGRAVRRRLKPGAPVDEPAAPPEDAARRSTRETARSGRRRAAVTNWVLVSCALVAVGISVYSLTAERPGTTLETVVVRQQIIEKTVTVTAGAGVAAATTVGATQGDATASPDTTASTTDTSAPDAESALTETTEPGQSTTTTMPGATGTTTVTTPAGDGETAADPAAPVGTTVP